MFLWSNFKYICNSDKYESCFIAIEVLIFSLHSASELLNPMLLNKYAHAHICNVFPQNIIFDIISMTSSLNNNIFCLLPYKIPPSEWRHMTFLLLQSDAVCQYKYFHISLWKWILTWNHSSMWPAFIETRGSNICFGVLMTWWGSFCKP